MTRVSRAWNAFFTRSEKFARSIFDVGSRSSTRPDRSRLTFGNEKSIIASVYNRLAIDIAAMQIQHVKVDENGRYLSGISSNLNDCLTVSANVDQTGTAFLQDVAMSLFDEGVVGIVPVDTTKDPEDSDAYDVLSLRVGKIREWYPAAVRIDLYNEQVGKHEEIVLPKRLVAIVENPLYAIMNEPNSTLKRLVRKLNLLDVVDEQSSSGKLDLIIQLPYIIKSEARREQAEARKKAIEDQLRGSEYGIAYTDGTEKIIQLNRPTENNLMAQIEYLTSMLYSQLGLTTGVMDGTADETTMLNYYRRTVEPVTTAIVESMTRTFISKTARTQGQRLMLFHDAFQLVSMADLAEAADKFTRNEILSSNDIRALLGFKPSKEKQADQLKNKNIKPATAQVINQVPNQNPTETPEGGMNVDGEAREV
jgi:hypothetical protein